MSILQKNIFYKGFMLVLSTILAISLVLPGSVMKADAETNGLNTEDQIAIDNFAEDLEFLFNEAVDLQDGKYIINEEVVAEKFGEENIASISAFIKMVNGEEITAADLEGIPSTNSFNSTPAAKFVTVTAKQSWKQCVGSKIIDATGIGFISGGLWKLIEREAWKQVAIELAKVAGKNAIKGGIVGFTASLAWYGIKCK